MSLGWEWAAEREGERERARTCPARRASRSARARPRSRAMRSSSARRRSASSSAARRSSSARASASCQRPKGRPRFRRHPLGASQNPQRPAKTPTGRGPQPVVPRCPAAAGEAAAARLPLSPAPPPPHGAAPRAPRAGSMRSSPRPTPAPPPAAPPRTQPPVPEVSGVSRFTHVPPCRLAAGSEASKQMSKRVGGRARRPRHYAACP
jgi:hypothetical protein